jgi:uncharacterized protein (TIGR03905 family)
MAIYRTKGTCSREIVFSVDKDNRLTDLKFLGGCSGNLQALSRILKGRNIHEIIPQIKGIQCRNGTSCPDQLAAALTEYIENSGKE